MHPVRPLVALKCKLGELEALCNLRSEHDANVRIMVELLDSVKPYGRLLPALVRAAVSFAGFHRTLWLDTTWLTSASQLASLPGGMFGYLDNLVESTMSKEQGLFAPEFGGFVPVVSVDATNEELRQVQFLLQHKDRDVAIRIRHSATSTQTLLDRIRSIVRLTGAQSGHAHVVLDLGFVEEVRTRQVMAATDIATAVLDMLGPGSTTLLAGSVPATRTTYATILQDRPEVALWDEVRRSSANEINFGDYGVTHPKPPASGSNPRNPYPYLCYTVPRKTLVLRRKQEKGDKPAELFADLAEELVERQDFAGPDYSWGDSELARCRRGGGRVAGSVSKWIAMATSHHLEHVSRRTMADL